MRINFSRVTTRAIIFFSQNTHRFLYVFLALVLYLSGHYAFTLLQKINVKPVDLWSFFGQGSENIEKTNDYTHFLLLGTRGEGTDSPNLSDSIIIFSYLHSEDKITVTSLPRDLWVPSLQAKINTAYHYGEVASPGAGIALAQASVLEITGIPINYTAVVNFTLFKKLIDLVGGVEVNLVKGFTDPQFPIFGRENALPESSRYESITFSAGNIHLDGDTALKFVRSRHSEGEEGTDFARSQRQQLLLGSLRQKVLTPEFLLNKEKVNSLLDLVSQNIKTNIPSSLYPYLVRLALNSYKNPFQSIPLSITPDPNGVSILYHPTNSNKYKGEWVLMPKDDNWSALKKYIQSHLTSTI